MRRTTGARADGASPRGLDTRGSKMCPRRPCSLPPFRCAVKLMVMIDGKIRRQVVSHPGEFGETLEERSFGSDFFDADSRSVRQVDIRWQLDRVILDCGGEAHARQSSTRLSRGTMRL